MAFNNSTPKTMNSISGKIILKETGMGIPDLLVVIYDLDPGTRSDENFTEPITRLATGAQPDSTLLGDRLGSVASAIDGSWKLDYEDDEFRQLNQAEKRPDLQLMVLAPEDADTGTPPVILFNSRLLRVNSGRQEAYIIRISQKQLLDAKITITANSSEEDLTASKIQQYRQKKVEAQALREGMKSVNLEFEAQDAPVNTDCGRRLRISFCLTPAF
jgi:hypothetical protein